MEEREEKNDCFIPILKKNLHLSQSHIPRW